VSAITTLTTPWLIRASGPVANYVDRRLPRALQTFVALYGSWVERLRSAPHERAGVSRTRHLIRLLLLDAMLLAVWVIGTSLQLERAAGIITRSVSVSERIARLIVLAGATVVAVPVAGGLLRTARQLGLTLALRALPATGEGSVDLAAAPRGMLVLTLQLAIVALVGAPIVAVTQPFLPPLRGVAVFVMILVILAVGFWRSATNLQGHAQAGAQLIVAALARQMATEPAMFGSSSEHGQLPGEEERAGEQLMEPMHRALPGLGDPISVRLWQDSPAVHRTLAELNLRGLTGATVLAIKREGEPVVIPTGHEVLRDGDVLAVAGTHDAIAAAVEILRTGG
jgi:CPA2 family monovalent cation:H+ antiporter-2